ncbi:MAG TPA: gliding motility protein GldC [Ferruginibacter sp.]|nr:gliding motility protein GldC [Ferruginibacter sp.]HRO17749.1 gliding motility protein GldC [Ferruginibacter sp.]HRQ21187.1 gliding motility protein GldC [Ferruginibacter sp.]
MQKSSIQIDIMLDPHKVPEQIHWNASDTRSEMQQRAKAMFLAFWDGADKTALRIDLWTKDMMVDEMGDFYYQMFMTMADTFQRATRQEALSEEMKSYAKDFFSKFKQALLKEQQP